MGYLVYGWKMGARSRLLVLVSLALSASQPSSATGQAVVGPEKGALVIVGGGRVGPEIAGRFVELAGGPGAEFVVIPTATEGEDLDLDRIKRDWVREFGRGDRIEKVRVLHTRDRAEADSEAFVAPLKKARGVWFGGGRQWRLVDSYLGTETQAEIEGVLARGGVIGGSSAGATIQGSYLVRGAREGNEIMMAPGYERGFGYLRGVAIDQHVDTRKRQEDLIPVIAAHPELLGLGIDESTALIVRGDVLDVIGRGGVGIYDGRDHDGKQYLTLPRGAKFDLQTRRRLAAD